MHPIAELNQPQEVKDALYKFSKERKGFFLLAGKNGTGKTYAAQTVLSCSGIWDTDHKIFIKQFEIQNRIQADMAKYHDVSYFLNQLTNTELLILDDIGTRPPTPSLLDFLYVLVDKRYERQKGTMITTNLNAQGMREQFSDAFVSRVASGVVFRLEGPDRRFKDF